MSNLRLSQKLQVLRIAYDGIINQAIANQSKINVECVSSIIKARSTQESFETSAPLLKNLTLGGKVRVYQLMDLHNNMSLMSRMGKIDRKTLRNVLARRVKLLADEEKGIFIHVKRPLCAQYPAI